MAMSLPVKILSVSILILLLTTCINGKEGEGGEPKEHGEAKEHGESKDMERKTKPGFCQEQRIHHSVPGSVRSCERFNPHYLKFFFNLFMIITWGAFVRTILRTFNISIPYTVVLMITGLLMGIGAHLGIEICRTAVTYTKIARMSPKIILNVFLPVLIYESAFNMKAHVFFRSISQILVLALPGMIIATFLTAFLCMQFLTKYNWTFSEASLFGSIISATDPVAVVAILRELGTSEMLSTAIEGESLLNDGVAILLYEVFNELVENEIHGKAGDSEAGLNIFILFIRITLGGPLFGFVMAKLAIFCLQKIFNDATVEITITLVAAYLTYYSAENLLGVSGVMAVVALGIIMSAEKTAISPEVESAVHHFWEMLGYLANTVLFVLVGIVITETAISGAKSTDLYYLLFLYLSLNVIRLGMLLVLSPWLSRIGYGLTWQNMIVMMWGGLRGAVGICLALEVYKNKELCTRVLLGPKILIQTAGIVILTLVINGTTTKKLLDILKVTQISIGRLQDMANAMKQMNGAKARAIATLKNDKFLMDSKWDLVEKYTRIENPYKKRNVKEEKLDKKKSKKEKKSAAIKPADIVELEGSGSGSDTFINPKKAPSLTEEIEKQKEGYMPDFKNLNVEEFKQMTEEARIRLLKSLKISYWRQFEHGILTDQAIQILVNVTETVEDRPLAMIHVGDIKKYWQIRGFFPWCQMKLANYFATIAALPPKPKEEWRSFFYWLTTKNWFDGIMTVIVLLNLIPVIWEFTLDIKEKLTHEYKMAFLITNIAFTFVYLLEIAFKLIGRGFKDYWTSKWNYIDFIVLLMSIVDISLSLHYIHEDDTTSAAKQNLILKLVKVLRILRIVRSLKLLKPLLPRINAYLQRRIYKQLFLGYDIAKGFVTAIDDALKFLPQMVDNEKIYDKLKNIMEYERIEVIRAMGFLQQKNPNIAIAVKTRQSSRAVLNQMRDCLFDLKEDGLVDDKESSLLLVALEEKMKRLWNSPPSIEPSAPQILLSNISWVLGNDDILTFLYNVAELKSYDPDYELCAIGDEPNGIYIIVSGMVRIHFEPSEEIDEEFMRGITPIVEFYGDCTFGKPRDDYYSTGFIIGEMGVLTNRRRAASVSCETGVELYYISLASMKEALEKFNDPFDSLEARIWRSCGTRLAIAFVPSQAIYSSWNLDRIRLHLERSAVPVGNQFKELVIPEWISDVVVIYGRVVNVGTSEVYSAPTLIPKHCTKISQEPGAKIMVISTDEIDHEEVSTSATNLQNVVTGARSMRAPPDYGMRRRSTLTLNRRPSNVGGKSRGRQSNRQRQ